MTENNVDRVNLPGISDEASYGSFGHYNHDSYVKTPRLSPRSTRSACKATRHPDRALSKGSMSSEESLQPAEVNNSVSMPATNGHRIEEEAVSDDVHAVS